MGIPTRENPLGIGGGAKGVPVEGSAGVWVYNDYGSAVMSARVMADMTLGNVSRRSAHVYSGGKVIGAWVVTSAAMSVFDGGKVTSCSVVGSPAALRVMGGKVTSLAMGWSAQAYVSGGALYGAELVESTGARVSAESAEIRNARVKSGNYVYLTSGSILGAEISSGVVSASGYVSGVLMSGGTLAVFGDAEDISGSNGYCSVSGGESLFSVAGNKMNLVAVWCSTVCDVSMDGSIVSIIADCAGGIIMGPGGTVALSSASASGVSVGNGGILSLFRASAEDVSVGSTCRIILSDSGCTAGGMRVDGMQGWQFYINSNSLCDVNGWDGTGSFRISGTEASGFRVGLSGYVSVRMGTAGDLTFYRAAAYIGNSGVISGISATSCYLEVTSGGCLQGAAMSYCSLRCCYGSSSLVSGCDFLTGGSVTCFSSGSMVDFRVGAGVVVWMSSNTYASKIEVLDGGSLYVASRATALDLTSAAGAYVSVADGAVVEYA